MTGRGEQQARYWLTEKGWAAVAHLSSRPPTTPTPTNYTEPQENSR